MDVYEREENIIKYLKVHEGEERDHKETEKDEIEKWDNKDKDVDERKVRYKINNDWKDREKKWNGYK